MANFKLALLKTLAYEGAYSNDTSDLGGETYKGISRNAHPNWQGWTQIDMYKHKCHFPLNLNENEVLQTEIEIFYHTIFWKVLKADQIQNQSIAESIFDFAVNAGIKTSVRAAQKIIGTKTDGVIGPQTLEKLNTINSDYFNALFTINKINHYISIVQKRPANKTYLYGWLLRTLYYT